MITFQFGLQVDVKNEKSEKINLYELSKMDAKMVAIKLKEDLEHLTKLMKKNENKYNADYEDALLMVNYCLITCLLNTLFYLVQ